MRRSRTGLGCALAVLAGAWFTQPASAALAATAPPTQARLQGSFLLAALITVADHVSGERRGQRFHRTWSFTSDCGADACHMVELARQRAGGTDHLALHRRSLGLYAGSSRFYAPLRCSHRTYRHGEAVPFTVTVRVTAAVATSYGYLATQVRATYVNRVRTNLTPCVDIPGHDAARYSGSLKVA